MTEELKTVTDVVDEDFNEWMNELDAETEEGNPEDVADVAEEESLEDVEADTEESTEPEQEVETEEESSVRQFQLESDDDVIAIDDSKITAIELKKLIEDYRNDTKWKQKNEERSRQLNQAQQIQAQIEADAEYAKYVASYQDSRARELSEYYDSDTAAAIRKLEVENQTLKQKDLVREAEELYTNEQNELLGEGVHQDDIVSAYELLSQNNAQYFQQNGRPMSLKEAYGAYIANGGHKIVMERMLKAQKEQIKKKEVSLKKGSMPRDIGGSSSNAPSSAVADDPMHDDIWQDELFKGIPIS